MPLRDIVRRRAGVVIAVASVTIVAGTGAVVVGAGWLDKDTTPPRVRITAPSPGATVSGSVSVTSKCFDSNGCAYVQLLVDGAVAATDTSSPFSFTWNTTTASNANHTLTLKAADPSGDERTSNPVTVAVANGGGGGGSAQVRVATTGNDSLCARNTFTACLSFNRGYQIAQPGDTVEVGCGTYGSQSLGFDSTKTTVPVLFRPPSGQTNTCVSIEGKLTGGSNGAFNSCARYVELDSMSLHGGNAIGLASTDYVIQTWGDCDNWVIDGWKGGRFDIAGSSNITVRGGDFGNCIANAADFCLMRVQGNLMSNNVAKNASGITIDGNAIHNITTSNAALYHPDGIAIFSSAGAGVTVKRNRFWANDVSDMPLQAQNGTTVENVTIENNWFRGAPNGETAGVTVRTTVAGLKIRFNSFGAGGGIVCNAPSFSCGTSGSHAKIYGNILTGVTNTQSNPCNSSNADYAYNLDKAGAFSLTQACSVTDSIVTSIPYTLDTASAIDYHITGASWIGDGFVPQSFSLGGSTVGCQDVTVDLDGDARETSGNCDAGADKR